MKSAVLVIDVQAGLFDGNPRPYEAEEVVHRINVVTERARAAGVPVLFIQAEHPTHDKEHLPASKIREHHNITLSKSKAVEAVAAAELHIVA